MKKVWTKLISILMICCFAFVFVGCGNTPDGNDEDNFNTTIGMYGTKVLYRPNSYDFNIGSGGTEENQNDYYGQYAWHILSALYNIYGIPDQESDKTLNILHKYLDKDSSLLIYTGKDTNGNDIYDTTSNIPYLYDSIRYKVDTLGNVTKREHVYNYEYTEEPKDKNTFTPYILVGADTNTTWNWTFNYNNENLPAFLTQGEPYSISESIFLNNKLVNFYENQENFNDALINAYYNTARTTTYNTFYIGGTEPQNYDEYSEYVKALEYVIYSYALDLEPNQITIDTNSTTTVEIDGVERVYPYAVNIVGYNSAIGKSAITQALEDRKELFNRLGSYVGLVDRQMTKVTNWILENVIGSKALANDTFTTYSEVTEVVTHTSETDYTVSYDFSNSAISSPDLGREYEDTVANIIEGVCSEVTIGSSGDGDGESGDVNIDERFLASEIKEYSGDTFMIQDDPNFKLPSEIGENTNLPYIQPLEYQSVTFMFKQPMYIADLWVALKYDAALDGTPDYDENNYIDIKLDLNFYDHDTNKYSTISSEVCRVYEGPYQIGYVGAPAKESDYAPTGHMSGYRFEEIGKLFGSNKSYIEVGAFNTEIGNGILKTDVGEAGYSAKVYVSQSPLVLVGTTNVRKYYSLIESGIDEGLADNHSYITGKLNPEMFTGSDGCDYLELTYKVIKKNGDLDTNYKFYSGVQFMNAMKV